MNILRKSIVYSSAALVSLVPAVVAAQDKTFNNPLINKPESLSISAVVGRIVQVILGMSGVVAAIVLIIAGIRVIFAQGNDDVIQQGKQAIIWAVVGLFVAFGGYIIVDIILQQGSAFLGN